MSNSIKKSVNRPIGTGNNLQTHKQQMRIICLQNKLTKSRNNYKNNANEGQTLIISKSKNNQQTNKQKNAEDRCHNTPNIVHITQQKITPLV